MEKYASLRNALPSNAAQEGPKSSDKVSGERECLPSRGIPGLLMFSCVWAHTVPPALQTLACCTGVYVPERLCEEHTENLMRRPLKL